MHHSGGDSFGGFLELELGPESLVLGVDLDQDSLGGLGLGDLEGVSATC